MGIFWERCPKSGNKTQLQEGWFEPGTAIRKKGNSKGNSRSCFWVWQTPAALAGQQGAGSTIAPQLASSLQGPLRLSAMLRELRLVGGKQKRANVCLC